MGALSVLCDERADVNFGAVLLLKLGADLLERNVDQVGIVELLFAAGLLYVLLGYPAHRQLFLLVPHRQPFLVYLYYCAHLLYRLNEFFDEGLIDIEFSCFEAVEGRLVLQLDVFIDLIQGL